MTKLGDAFKEHLDFIGTQISLEDCLDILTVFSALKGRSRNFIN